MIKEGGIICVTGSARTGTSMMMQTLINLGYKTPAKKFIKEQKGIEDKNPKGFYELAEEVINGVHHDNYKGQAVKLFPGCLWKTEKEFISKIIICKRNKVDATKSYTPIHKIMEEPYTPSEIYDVNYEIINEYIDQYDTENYAVLRYYENKGTDVNTGERPRINDALPLYSEAKLNLFLVNALRSAEGKNVPYLEYQFLSDFPIGSPKTEIKATVRVDDNIFTKTIYNEIDKPLIDFAVQN